MDVMPVITRYLEAFARHDLGEMNACTTDDLRFVLPDRELRKPAFLELMAGLFRGFPDWGFEHGRLRCGWDHATIELRMHGTHTGVLALPLPGLEPIEPTGRQVVLPPEDIQYSLSQGRISQIEPTAVPGGGIPGILEQIGAPLPSSAADG
jgi:hypothetical protein